MHRWLDLLLVVMLTSCVQLQHTHVDIALIGALLRRLKRQGGFVEFWPALRTAVENIAVWAEPTTGLRQDIIWRTFSRVEQPRNDRATAVQAISSRIIGKQALEFSSNLK